MNKVWRIVYGGAGVLAISHAVAIWFDAFQPPRNLVATTFLWAGVLALGISFGIDFTGPDGETR